MNHNCTGLTAIPATRPCCAGWTCRSEIQGSTHFLTRTLPRVRTEMSLHVLAYNLKRAMQILGIGPLMQAMGA